MPLIHGLGVRLAVVSVMRRRLAAARRESSFVDGIGAEHPREHLRANLPPLDLHVSIISARPLFHPSLTALAHPLSSAARWPRDCNPPGLTRRPKERRVGKEGVSTCR